MKAQEVLLKTGIVAKEMTEGRVEGSHELMRQRVCELDSLILSVISNLDHAPELRKFGADAAAVLNKWHMARFLAYT